MKNIEKCYGKSTICVLVQNDCAAAILEKEGDYYRIAFYDEDGKFIEDWGVDGYDYSSEIKELIEHLDSNKPFDIAEWFYKICSSTKLIKMVTFQQYLDLKAEMEEECWNRFGDYFLIRTDI